jgi:hypothetical protein
MLTVRELAEHLGVGVATVADWLKQGEDAKLRLSSQRILVKDLATASDDVRTRFETILASAKDPEHKIKNDERSASAGDHMAAAEAKIHEHGFVGPGVVISSGVDRRTFLNLGTATAVTSVAGMAGINLENPNTVTNADIKRLDMIVTRLRVLDSQHGGVGLWDVAESRARAITSLLETAEYSDEVGSALIDLAARANMCAGWLATDAGHHDVARTFYTETITLAGQKEIPEIHVFALATLALQAIILRQPRQAMRCVDAAEQALPAEPAGGIKALLLMRRARVQAMMGDAHSANQTFTAARHSFDQDRATPPPWLDFFGHPDISSVEGDAAFDLRKPERGLVLMQEATTEREEQFLRNHCLDQVRLAKAHLLVGQVDGGAKSLSGALDQLESDVASVRIGNELRLVADQFQPHRKVDVVHDVLERYRATPYGVAA